jgi:hypothetical protein
MQQQLAGMKMPGPPKLPERVFIAPAMNVCLKARDSQANR